MLLKFCFCHFAVCAHLPTFLCDCLSVVADDTESEHHCLSSVSSANSLCSSDTNSFKSLSAIDHASSTADFPQTATLSDFDSDSLPKSSDDTISNVNDSQSLSSEEGLYLEPMHVIANEVSDVTDPERLSSRTGSVSLAVVEDSQPVQSPVLESEPFISNQLSLCDVEPPILESEPNNTNPMPSNETESTSLESKPLITNPSYCKPDSKDSDRNNEHIPETDFSGHKRPHDTGRAGAFSAPSFNKRPFSFFNLGKKRKPRGRKLSEPPTVCHPLSPTSNIPVLPTPLPSFIDDANKQYDNPLSYLGGPHIDYESDGTTCSRRSSIKSIVSLD